MKILAGQFKNHAIQSNKKFAYRPTTSVARKSIFDAGGMVGNPNSYP